MRPSPAKRAVPSSPPESKPESATDFSIHPDQETSDGNAASRLQDSGERRYRETSGLYWEDFEPGDVFEHRPGRTVLDVDNTYFTLLTLNIQQVHFDAAYAANTEWKKMLVDSTSTLALLTGMSVRTVSAKVVANLGWD